MIVMIAATLLSLASGGLQAKGSRAFCTTDFLTCGFGVIFTRIGGC
jgi:hypothetical protein